MIKKYKKKPILVDVTAIQFNGKNYEECEQFIGKENYDATLEYPNVKTPNGISAVPLTNYIVKSCEGDFYTVPSVIFEAIYEGVSND